MTEIANDWRLGGSNVIAPVFGPFHPAPLHNIEAEQALLGALLYDNAAFERLPDNLEPEHFSEPVHGRMFRLISTLIRKGMLAEPILAQDHLKTDPAYEELGGLRYLADLVDRAPPASMAPDYARAVLETARRRALCDLGGELITGARSGDPNFDSLAQIEAAESRLYALAEPAAGGRAGQGFQAFSDVLAKAVQMSAEAYSRDGGLAGLSTGLIDLDAKLGGLHPSDLIILAGRPSMGKSAMAANIGFNVARNYAWTPQPDGSRKTTAGGVVAFFSLEMSAEQLGMRLLGEVSGVSSDRIRKGEISAQEFGLIRDAAMEIESAPFHIDATGGISLAKLAARARRLKRTSGLDLLIVDYLQLITSDVGRAGENRVQEVTQITMGLKALAKELNVPIIALSQLSRKVEEREDKKPMLSDLRESGSIEQDADAVIFVYREEYYLSRTEPDPSNSVKHMEWQEKMDAVRGMAEAIIGKQRHGPIGTVRLSFNETLTKFGNLARDGRFGRL